MHSNNITHINSNVSKYIIDLLCVASHYSNRYKNADNFLNECTEILFVEHALYLHRNTPENIVNNFINKSIQKCSGASIKGKNMIFLWKKYLEENNLPNIIFYESLKTMFYNKLQYNEEIDTFIDVTSIHLPQVSNFIEFWDQTILEDTFDSELEIDELSKLFRYWKNERQISLSDDLMIELIRHFFPEIIIEENKYIINVKCSIWNKREEVNNSLELFKIWCNDEGKYIQSIYLAYEFYCNYNKGKWNVSKRYYEKVSRDTLGINIDIDGVLLQSWLVNL